MSILKKNKTRKLSIKIARTMMKIWYGVGKLVEKRNRKK